MTRSHARDLVHGLIFIALMALMMSDL